MCCHDVNKNECTLYILPNRRMVLPNVYTMQCSECHEIFSIKDEDIEDKNFIKNHFLSPDEYV